MLQVLSGLVLFFETNFDIILIDGSVLIWNQVSNGVHLSIEHSYKICMFKNLLYRPQLYPTAAPRLCFILIISFIVQDWLGKEN